MKYLKFEEIKHFAENNPTIKLDNLMHKFNVRAFEEAHRNLHGDDKATGIDRLTRGDFKRGKGFSFETLEALMKANRYKPMPFRIVKIPKGDGKYRKLCMPCYSDKIVQHVIKCILESIFVKDFPNTMYGFIEGKGCSNALWDLKFTLSQPWAKHVIMADITGYFDNLNHELILSFLEERIKDRKFLELVQSVLKAGEIENGTYVAIDKGAGQGAVCSPIIANIYMYKVLMQWARTEYRAPTKGKWKIINYADDFIVIVENEGDANILLTDIRNRLQKFKLELNMDKTKVLPVEDSNIDFLGFRFDFIGVKNVIYTRPKSLAKSMLKLEEWFKGKIELKLEDWNSLAEIIRGHYLYFGIEGNDAQLCKYYVHTLYLIQIKLNANRKSEESELSISEVVDIASEYGILFPNKLPYVKWEKK